MILAALLSYWSMVSLVSDLFRALCFASCFVNVMCLSKVSKVWLTIATLSKVSEVWLANGTSTAWLVFGPSSALYLTLFCLCLLLSLSALKSLVTQIFFWSVPDAWSRHSVTMRFFKRTF